MRKILSRLRIGVVPFILCLALMLTGIMSIHSIMNLQGNARVINYTGIIRGATQRSIKKELNHVPDDDLIKRVDNILDGLSNGSDDLDLIKIKSGDYQKAVSNLSRKWAAIKKEIYRYRKGNVSGDKLFKLSEEFFYLADETVDTAEVYTEEVVQDARNLLFYINLIFILMAAVCTFFAVYQEKRRKKLIEAEKENMRKSEQLSKRFEEMLIPINEMSELMYVSDVNTYELLFANDVGKKTFHISDEKNQKCYKVIQGLDAPCPFCPNEMLAKDENYTWEHTNPITKRHYLLKDRLMEWEGRLARMEIAFDITDAANEKKELKARLERDSILVKCIRELYQNQDMLDATRHVLRQLGELFFAERSYVFSIHGDYLTNIAEWCREDITPQIDNLQKLPKSDFAYWLNMFEDQKNVVIKDIENIKCSMPLEYEFLLQQGIKSVVMVPLERDGKLDGLIGLDNPPQGLMENAATFLETLRYYIMLAIRRNEDEKELYRLSYLDTLTSFFNRNRYIQDVDNLQGKEHSVGVVYLDVNGLKEINDHLGHDSGDDLLKECARTVKDSFTEGSFYRIGGDEFIILCTDLSEESFKENIHRLRNNFAHSECRTAIGFKWAPNCHDIEKIIKTADEYMYADKKRFYHNHHETGRYRHQNDVLDFLCDPDVLKEKISNKQFQVYLQAKMDIETRRVVGAEALVRYLDDEGIIQPPDKFIPVLEGARQVSKIDFYVFDRVCAQLQDWKAQGRTLFPISSNFSRTTFMEDHFLERLEAVIVRYEISREYLDIEITESTCSADCRELKDQINRIREAGFRVSVDDFGAESSNLALLAAAQFDILKIDKGFVKDIIDNEYAQTIVEAMVGVCEKMNIQLVAEGIENEAQLEVLKKCGVKTVQGFLFSKPMPVKEYEWKYLDSTEV
ncbi:sensor domain-containing phosphodiesterase [Anaerostipes sp.]|uniref:sensor domain-containing phosphodiesterase n=1 Tax=Anaerostipes sp. TaxID=1872530 RepID=UPI0025C51D2B|nr:GGDEF domain-containing protein [Anaerostipes sp.]MBS7007823.1 GGDEF domain-containing protein [Anaerostipes sp.]